MSLLPQARRISYERRPSPHTVMTPVYNPQRDWFETCQRGASLEPISSPDSSFSDAMVMQKMAGNYTVTYHMPKSDCVFVPVSPSFQSPSGNSPVSKDHYMKQTTCVSPDRVSNFDSCMDPLDNGGRAFAPLPSFSTPSRRSPFKPKYVNQGCISPDRVSNFDSCTEKIPNKKRFNNSIPEDPKRRSKMKSELCSHFMKNGKCPYEDGCHYAHGEDELQHKTLGHLKDAGLVDVDTYRTRPCLSWVSTGAW
eukprot:scaffold4463_cov51-Attheya_sp.AAC.6